MSNDPNKSKRYNQVAYKMASIVSNMKIEERIDFIAKLVAENWPNLKICGLFGLTIRDLEEMQRSRIFKDKLAELCFTKRNEAKSQLDRIQADRIANAFVVRLGMNALDAFVIFASKWLQARLMKDGNPKLSVIFDDKGNAIMPPSPDKETREVVSLLREISESNMTQLNQYVERMDKMSEGVAALHNKQESDTTNTIITETTMLIKQIQTEFKVTEDVARAAILGTPEEQEAGRFLMDGGESESEGGRLDLGEDVPRTIEGTAERIEAPKKEKKPRRPSSPPPLDENGNPMKRGRGRPKGSKNKARAIEPNEEPKA